MQHTAVVGATNRIHVTTKKEERKKKKFSDRDRSSRSSLQALENCCLLLSPRGDASLRFFERCRLDSECFATLQQQLPAFSVTDQKKENNASKQLLKWKNRELEFLLGFFLSFFICVLCVVCCVLCGFV